MPEENLWECQSCGYMTTQPKLAKEITHRCSEKSRRIGALKKLTKEKS
jgi:hypothetical protein